MIHEPLPPEAWAAEAVRIAPSLDDVAAAVIIGSDPDVSVIVALAIARAQHGRRVAIGDLVGDLHGLRASDDRPGLLECFRDGIPVSDIAHPIGGDESVFVLPSGHGPIAERWVFESARWARLIAGFREVDALLLLIAPPGTPGLPTLIAAVDGVVAVDIPPTLMRAWPLLATIDRPEPELPEIATPSRPFGVVPAVDSLRLRRRRRLIAGSVLLASATLAAAAVVLWRRPVEMQAAADAAVEMVDEDAAAAAVAHAAAAPIPADTITLGPVVNPGDSANAALFAVELVAANTLAGANSRLAMRGEKLPAPTLAPVLLGSDGRPWFRALTGAWRQRDDAQAWLDALRERGLVRQDVGRVLRVPYALRLADGVRVAEVPAELARWQARGIPAYALVQDDGSVRVLAGAFETSGQAALLAKSLRDLGAVPVMAFRTGRTF